jgi:hypothetical protein
MRTLAFRSPTRGEEQRVRRPARFGAENDSLPPDREFQLGSAQCTCSDLASQKGRVLLCQADRRTQKRRIPLDPQHSATQRVVVCSKGTVGDDVLISHLDILVKVPGEKNLPARGQRSLFAAGAFRWLKSHPIAERECHFSRERSPILSDLAFPEGGDSGPGGWPADVPGPAAGFPGWADLPEGSALWAALNPFAGIGAGQ